MQHLHFIDFTAVMESVTKISRLIGVWSKTEPFFTMNIYSIYAMFVLINCNLFYLVQVAYWFFGKGNFETIIWSATVIFEQILTNVKAYGIITNQRMLKQLAESSNRDIFQPKNAKQKQLAMPTLREFEMFYKFFGIAGTATGIFMGLYPLIDRVIDTNKEAYLPFLAWYPYNSTKFFAVSYTHQAVCAVYMAEIQVNADCLSICLMAFVGIQCDMLADSLRNIAEYTKKKMAKKTPAKSFAIEMENSLRDCIEHHKQIMNYFDQIYVMLNTSLLAQFVASAISICLTLFQLSTESMNSKFFTMISYQNALMCQLLLYCWWGDKVIEKSEQLPLSAFEGGWLDTSKKYKCNLLIFIHRTQKPLTLYAVDYFRVSLQSFMMILRHAYSFFAVLHRMNT